MNSRVLAALLGIAFLSAVAPDALACPACADTSGSKEWFRYTTVLLSLIPLVAIGGVILWIRRQVAGVAGNPGG